MTRRKTWVAVGVSLLLTSCVGPPPPEGPLGDHPLGPVLLCHGSWPDNPYMWVDDLQEQLHRRGIESISVPHSVVLGVGVDAPAERIAFFTKGLAEQHERTKCAEPLRLVGVGYSSGTDVLTEACGLGARFERCYFAGSPLSLWNGDMRDALKSEQMKSLVNYFSPTDLLMWVTMGSGMFGYHGAGWEVVDNRLHFWPHVMPIWNRDHVIQAIADELEAAGAQGKHHTCFAEPSFRRWYRVARERLRTDWEPREELRERTTDLARGTGESDPG